MGLARWLGRRPGGRAPTFRIGMVVSIVVLGGAGSASGAAWQALVTNDVSYSNSVSDIDTGSNVVGATVPVGADPAGIAIAPDGLTAFVADANGGQITPIDLTTSPFSARSGLAVPTGGYPLELGITPDGTTMLVTYANAGTFSKVDLTASPPTVGASLSDGTTDGAQNVAIAPDGRTAYLTDGPEGQITPIDIATGGHGTPIAVGTTPASAGAACPSAASSCPYAIAITPDGRRLLVGDQDSDQLSIVDLASGNQVTNVPLAGPGHPRQGIAVSPDGAFAYVAVGSQIDPVDLTNATALPTIPVVFSDDPAHGVIWPAAITPDGHTLYVGDGYFGGGGGPFGDLVHAVPVNNGAAAGDQTEISTGDEPWGIAITPDQAPLASFTATTAAPGTPSSFDASASTVAYGTIASYAWDFGDGAQAVTSTPETTHTYTTAGTYKATVTETSSAGTSATGTIYTGQTAARVASASAQTTRSVIVTSGPFPAVAQSTTALAFGSVGVGHPSTPQTVTLTNTGTAPLNVSAATVGATPGRAAARVADIGPPHSAAVRAASGDFGLSTDGCTGQPVAPGASCTVAVVFNPTSEGGRVATLAFSDDASGSPHTVALTGTGTVRGTLAGTVTRADGGAIAGAELSVCVPPGFSDCRDASTGADGTYSLGDLPPGPRSIEVFPPSGVRGSAAARLTVAAGPNRRDFMLSAPQAISRGVAFQTPAGRTANGVPVVNWNEPFSFDVPVAVPAHRAPGSVVVLPVSADIGLDPGDGSDGGFSLVADTALAVTYDAAGRPRGVAAVQDAPTADATRARAARGPAGVRTAKDRRIDDIPTLLKLVPRVARDKNGNAYLALTIPLRYGASIAVTIRRQELANGSVDVGTAYKVTPPSYDGACPPEDFTQYQQLFSGLAQGITTRIDAALGAGGRAAFDSAPRAAAAIAIAISQGLRQAAGAAMGVPVNQSAARALPAGSAGAHPAQTTAPALQMTAEVLVAGAPVDVAPLTSAGVAALRSGGHSVPISVRFTVPSLGRTVRGALAYEYFTPTTTIVAHRGLPATGARDAKLIRTRPTADASCDGTPAPPKPAPKPGGGGDAYADPSGVVQSTGQVPLADATVVLYRGSAAAGPLTQVPNGSVIMSPANRRNPDRTDSAGHFGWDVLPGFYQVSASRPGCTAPGASDRTARSKVLPVPPPVDNLLLMLRCPHLERTSTTTTIRSVRRRASTLLLAWVRARRGHPAGTVAFTVAGSAADETVVDPRTGTAALVVPRVLRGRAVARYAGDASHAPSRTRP